MLLWVIVLSASRLYARIPRCARVSPVVLVARVLVLLLLVYLAVAPHHLTQVVLRACLMSLLAVLSIHLPLSLCCAHLLLVVPWSVSKV